MAHSRALPMVSILAAVALALVSCNNNDSTGPTGNSNLAGTYTLDSLTYAGQPATATGTMTLTDSTYTASLTMTAPQPFNFNDVGTYSASGGTWTQVSSTGLGTYSGTYTLTNNTLRVNVTIQGVIQLGMVWQRQ
jgi:hypothetical protein